MTSESADILRPLDIFRSANAPPMSVGFEDDDHLLGTLLESVKV